MKPHVLYEDNHLLVVDKPAGMATAGVTDAPSVYLWAAEYLRQRYNKPGNVYVGIVSRLDTLTSGVLVVARTSKAAARLSDQIRRGTPTKRYWALVEGTVDEGRGEMRDRVYKDDAAHRMRVAHAGHDGDAQDALLRYHCLLRTTLSGTPSSLMDIQLVTGRKHQIRVQFAARRHPVFGDRKYGSTQPLLGRGIALHARQIQFEHPTRREPMTFTAPLPPEWPEVARNLQ